MRGGLGLGTAASRGALAVVWEAALDALSLSTSANAAELQAALVALGFLYTRPSVATVQTSASEVVTVGIDVDVPRVGNAGYGQGLVIEDARTNVAYFSHAIGTAGGWNAGTAATTTGYAAGPDGAAGTATRIAGGAGAFGTYSNRPAPSAGATSYVGSVWARLVNRAIYPSIQPASPTPTANRFSSTPGHDLWFRSSTPVRTASSAYCFQTHDPGASVDAAFDFAQVEAGTWASEAIVTVGATATRAADRLAIDASRIVRSGRVGLALRAILKGSIGGSNDYAADPYLWRYDASNYCTINRTTGAATVVIAGASYTTASGFTAARGDVVDYWVEAGGGALQTVVKARKNSGAVTTLGTGAAQGTHPSATSMDLLSNAATAPLSAWLQLAQAYAPGRRIAWAA